MEILREKNKKKFFSKCNEVNSDNIDLSDFIYKDNRTYGKCKCKICGHEWEETPESLVKRKECPKCLKNKRDFLKRDKSLLKNKEIAENIYENSKITDIEFFYNDKNELMVKFVCHETYCDGTEHGLQIQNGYYFLKNNGCSKCSKHPSKAYSTEEWVRLAKNKYPDFDYSKVEYVNKDTKVLIICPEHGEFSVNPKDFLHGRSYCPLCKEKKQHDDFVKRVIEKCKKAHDNDDYVYHPEFIKNSTEKIGIECKKHGMFWQTINNHVTKKSRCPHCVKEEQANLLKLTFEDVVKEANKIHNNKYIYHEETYINTSNKTLITCPIHGDFTQTMHNHIGGQGCPKCGNIKKGQSKSLTSEEFLNRIKNVHKNQGYDFSFVEYKGLFDKVKIICPKHGEFKSKPTSLLSGCGCPVCKMPKLEKSVRNILIENNIVFQQQKRFKDWLGQQSLDFYLPKFNIAIECQGSQHFKNERRYNKLEEVKKRDEKKKKLCLENEVHLIYYVPKFFEEYMSKDDIYFTDLNELINYITNYNKII